MVHKKMAFKRQGIVLNKAEKMFRKVMSDSKVISIIGEKFDEVLKNSLSIYDRILSTRLKDMGYPALVRAAILIACEQAEIKIKVEDLTKDVEYLDANVSVAIKSITDKFPKWKQVNN